ncbi:MAG TPA: PfkB family carbohydrate kinase [Bryobacteraceae bacterium]|jgi:D-beta-D-heptose 7-phosphate kinase/D-beta-D-heptose 1-phosphate adenosyltransferase
MDASRLAQLIPAFASKRILVAGDLMLDEFVWGRVSRISPEAPVPVVEVVSESAYPGGAANVARNLREFTGHADLLGIAGADGPGTRLLELLDERGIGTSGVQRSPDDRTIVKTRVIARQQQIVRVDRDTRAAITPEKLERVRTFIEDRISETDAIIFADYGKGFLTQPVVDLIASIARPRGVLMIVDPNPNNPIEWRGMTAIKPNRVETIAALGAPVDIDSQPALVSAAHRLQAKWETGIVLITLGEHGMWLFEDGHPPFHTEARAKEVFDVSGAGDTAIALFTLALASGASAREAAEIANAASGVVVGKLGTATLTPAELIHAME